MVYINTIMPVSIALAGVGANIFVVEASEVLLPKMVEGVPKTAALLSPEGASPKFLGEEFMKEKVMKTQKKIADIAHRV